jgi:SAM-dependent methyltransferase
MREWFESEAFWRDFYPIMFTEQRFAAAEDEVRKMVKLIRIRRGAALDLCCGPGRHSVAFAKRGFRVTAVDRTRFLLNKAKRRARVSRVKVEFVLSDMRNFVRPGTFDVALSLFTSFGYFDDKRDDLRVLKNIFGSLKPHGVLVMELAGKEWLAKIFQATTSVSLPDGTVLVERHEIIDDWSRVRNEWILIKGNRARRYKFHHTIYSAQELKSLLIQTGFADVKLYGDFAGKAYGRDSTRLVAVARKG